MIEKHDKKGNFTKNGNMVPSSANHLDYGNGTNYKLGQVQKSGKLCQNCTGEGATALLPHRQVLSSRNREDLV